MRERWRHLSTKICKGGGLILFSFIFKWRTRKKRARYQQRNLIDCIQNYTCTYHFIRNIRQTCSDKHTEIESH